MLKGLFKTVIESWKLQFICSSLDSVVWQPYHKVSVQAMHILQGEWLCLVIKLLFIATETQGKKVKDTFPYQSDFQTFFYFYGSSFKSKPAQFTVL